MNFLKIFSVFGLVGKWYDKAMEDGQVTLPELVELGISLGGVIGLNIAPEVMAVVTETATDVLDAVEDAVDITRNAVDKALDSVELDPALTRSGDFDKGGETE